jgi:glucosamine 6-phosphate synthetase-like amidotransferase/phosphosugar isomerase protein
MAWHVSTEIADQPSAWARAAMLAITQPIRDVLPEPGQRVAITGCGTSFFMGQSFAALREGSGHGETDAFPASEFPTHRSYDAVVALSRSGTTSTPAARDPAGRNGAAYGRHRRETPVVELADHHVILTSPMKIHGKPDLLPRPWQCGGPGAKTSPMSSIRDDPR